MSLISEALRKARAEAAEREGRGRAIPRALALPPKRWRSGPGLFLLVVIVLGAAFGGAAIAWWAFGRRPSPRGLRTATAGAVARAQAEGGAPGAAAATPAPALPRAPAPTSPPFAAQGEGNQGARAPRAGGLDAGVVNAPTPPAVSTRPGAAERERPLGGAVGAESQTEPRERSFIIDADLGYAKLHLDYIVYRPGSPFASINGGQVVVGSLIDGFTVDEIAQDSVTLSDRHGTVVLRVH